MIIVVVVGVVAVLLATATGSDNQIIVALEDEVRQYAASLYSKHRGTSTMLQWKHELFEGFQHIDGDRNYVIRQGTQIYMVASGSKDTQFGACTAHEIGNILVYLIGGKASNIGRISLVTSNSATSLDTSFACQLLMYLYNRGISTEVSAKTAAVAGTGQKVTKHGITWTHQAKTTNIVAYIKNKAVFVKDDQELVEDLRSDARHDLSEPKHDGIDESNEYLNARPYSSNVKNDRTLKKDDAEYLSKPKHDGINESDEYLTTVDYRNGGGSSSGGIKDDECEDGTCYICDDDYYDDDDDDDDDDSCTECDECYVDG